MSTYSICHWCYAADQDDEYTEIYIDEEDKTITLCPECEKEFEKKEMKKKN